MITSALKWLLDHVPVALIPPQFQLALTLLRGLVPLLGYIGGFIAWSWSAIRVFDRGTPKADLMSLPCDLAITICRVWCDLDSNLAVANRHHPRNVASLRSPYDSADRSRGTTIPTRAKRGGEHRLR